MEVFLIFEVKLLNNELITNYFCSTFGNMYGIKEKNVALFLSNYFC